MHLVCVLDAFRMQKSLFANFHVWGKVWVGAIILAFEDFGLDDCCFGRFSNGLNRYE